MKRRRSLVPVAVIVLAVVVAAGAVVVVSNPRHRAFYLGASRGPSVGAGTTGAVVSTVSFRSPPKGEGAAAEPPRARVPVPDASGRVEVPLADRVPWNLPADGTPPGWTLKEFAGRADIELLRTDGRLALRLRSDRASFALHRDVLLDVRTSPILTWSWKVLRLPSGGDVRHPGRDDEAAQLYVIFPRWPSPLARSAVIGYVWDTTTPAGTWLTNPRAENVKIVVVESGAAKLGAWQRYERNVAEDYAALFGGRPPRIGKVAIMVDSNDTRSEAEVLVGGLAFRPAR